jgi:hypothetical protein
VTLPGWPHLRLEIALNVDANDPAAPAAVWTPLTSRLRAWHTDGGWTPESGTYESVTLTAALGNGDGALDPDNPASPYYPALTADRWVRLQMDMPNGPVIDVYQGLTEGLPQAWREGKLGEVELTAKDTLAVLAKAETLRSVYLQEVLQDTPVALYPFDEPEGAEQFQSAVGAWPPAEIVRSKYGAGTVTAGVDGLLGVEPGTCVQLGGAGDAGGGNQNKGSVLELAKHTRGGPMLTSSAAGIAVEAWATLPAADAATNINLVSQATKNLGAGDYVIAVEAATGKLVFRLGSGSVTTTLAYDDGLPHHLVLSKVEPGTDPARCYVDGVEVAQIGGDPGYFDSAPGWLQLGGLCTPYNVQNFGNFAVQYVAIYDHGLTAARVTAHYQAGQAAFAGELSGARVNRLLDYAGYFGPRDIDTGNTPMAPLLALDGANTLAELQDTTAAERGALYAQPDGSVRFEERTARYNLPEVWVFGGRAQGDELQYRDDVQFRPDDSHIVNVAQFSRPGGGTVVREDAASRRRHFYRPLAVELKVATDTELQAAAEFTIARQAEPLTRLEQLSVCPSLHPEAWDAALGLRVGQRVGVVARVEGGRVKDGSFIVEAPLHDANPSMWVTSFRLSSAETSAMWQLNDPVYGQLDAGNLVAY